MTPTPPRTITTTTPTTTYLPLCMVHPLPHHLLHPPTPPPPSSSSLSHAHRPSLTPLYASLHGLWPLAPTPRPAPPAPPTQPTQDHSGTLGAEEFKACLISLGFDIANDAQVPERSRAPAARGLTAVFCTSLPSHLSLAPPFVFPLPLSCFFPPPDLCSSSSHVVPGDFLLFATSTLRTVAARLPHFLSFSRSSSFPLLSSLLLSPSLSILLVSSLTL